jgi:signal peptidase I
LEETRKKEKFRKKSKFRDYAEALAIAVLLAVFIRTFVVQAFKIPSGSMIPTLLVGDHILVNKFIYGVKIPFVRTTLIPISRPERGDVVVFIYPKDKSKDYIKRVIGLPGDKIEIRDKEIYINGKFYVDEYGKYEPNGVGRGNPVYRREPYGPKTVPENKIFVMGDNRDHSSDSRVWGFVPMENIKGKAFIIYFSWPHLKRFLHPVR